MPGRKDIEPYVVRGHPLDPQQMSAVTADAFTQLVLAGAGTGKTTTLIGKVRHLVEAEGADPRRMLMISLTNNTVSDLRKAVFDEFGPSFQADMMTIHSLGNRILHRKPCVGPVRNAIIRDIMYELVQIDRSSARALMEYVDGMRAAGSSDIAFNGMQIRNRGLRAIADALYECGVPCEYERPTYRGDVPVPASLTAKDEDGHSISVTSDDEECRAAARDPEEAWGILASKGFPNERMNVNDLASEVLVSWGERIPESIGNLISRCKCTRTSVHQLIRSNGRTPVQSRASVEARLRLVDRVWDLYNMACIEKGMVDYDDMVIQATDHVVAGGNVWMSYDHVLIDEYQDVSPILVDLVRALRKSMGFKLFCVGDDWQSIYSFSGGDVWQIYDFERIWGEWGDVSVSRIERTYRCPQPIVEMTNRFVSKNPCQQRKDVRGVLRSALPPVQMLPVSGDKDIPKMIANRLDFIDPKEDVFIIGRTRNDVFALGNGSGQFSFALGGRQGGSVEVRYRRWDEGRREWADVRTVRFLTAHSSKGLEADNVFLIAERDRGGFPNNVNDDISNLFSVREEGVPYAEERRVFYVAMTRARKRMFIVNRTEDGFALSSMNPFVKELIDDNRMLLVKSTPMCPECGSGMKVKQYGGRRFYSCVDYPGCKGTKDFFGL